MNNDSSTRGPTFLYSREAIISQIKAKSGFVFKEFELNDVGPYGIEDASWNYRDALLHIPYVHRLVKNVPFAVSDEVLCNLFFQKTLLGLKVPMLVVDTEPHEKNYQLTFASCLFFCMIIQNTYTALDAERTQVNTRYAVGMPRLLSWTFPILRFAITRNYKDLMSTDVPMRHRRGLLRRLGYRFRSDEAKSFLDAMALAHDNVVAPKNALTTGFRLDVDLSSLARKDQGSLLVGTDRADGFRIEKRGDEIQIFPRICPHEGASLDHDSCEGKTLMCSWHGRKIKSLATFEWGRAQTQTARHPVVPEREILFEMGEHDLKITLLDRARI